MTTALDQVTVDTQCLVQECEKQGCTVDLAGAPKQFRLIDMDHPRSPAAGTRCDYLFIGVAKEKTIDLDVVPLELKSSGFHAASVSKQLAGGAKVAERMIPKAHFDSCRWWPTPAPTEGKSAS